MKKLLLPMVMGLLLFIGLTSLTQIAPPPNECKNFCTLFGDLYRNHGACMSTCRVCTGTGNTTPVCVCKSFNNLGLENQGQCIGYVRNILAGQ